MGRDKASIRAGAGAAETLAERTARLLRAATRPALEVGPGRTSLLTVRDAGEGPLAALAAGSAALRALGWTGAAVVVATDLPFLTAGMLSWLADHPVGRSVVPVDGGRLQPLCARFEAPALAVAETLAAGGARAMRDLLEAIDPLLAGPEAWRAAAGEAGALLDVDTPEDLARLPGYPP